VSAAVKVDRREFFRLTSAAAAGLVLAANLPSFGAEEKAAADFGPFLQIGADDQVTIWFAKSEMGQGVRTALPLIVAEELDADWKRVSVRQAPLDAKYGDQGTGGSDSVFSSWEPLRRVGASARMMLLAAAAARWSVEAGELGVERGVVTHAASGRKTTFGELAVDAAKLPVPPEVRLKEPGRFTLLGKELRGMGNRDLVTGAAKFGSDVHLTGMLYASVLRSPVFGGKVVSVDDAKALAIAGVKKVVKLEAIGAEMPWSGVAVVATSTWAAMKGRAALTVKWDEGSRISESSETLSELFADLGSKSGRAIRNDGDAEAALAAAPRKLEATYEVPYLAHATMEPQTCTAVTKPDSLELWAPTQEPEWAASAAAKAAGLTAAQTRVHVTLLGGGFGRRIHPDFAVEAALISKAVGGVPVKVQWTREDDLQHGYYRPASQHRLSASLDEQGNPAAWLHRIVSPSITGYQRGSDAKNIEGSETGGAVDLPFRIPNLRVEYAYADSGVPRGWWRSVSHSTNAFVVQSFLDELAHAAGKDPIEYQLALLTVPPPRRKDDAVFDVARMRQTIELVREQAGWGKPLPEGYALGFAAHFAFRSYTAEIAEVSVGADGKPRVHRVVAAIDCGFAVNPDGVRAQIEGGIVFGLTAALHGRISIADGRVEQRNFHEYPLLRMNEMPPIAVHIVPSAAPPTGVGEAGVPPIAPAVTNAIFVASGVRLRELPIRPESLKKG
jgi:isoquinoline 1-oxidoreductase beta subunit